MIKITSKDVEGLDTGQVQWIFQGEGEMHDQCEELLGQYRAALNAEFPSQSHILRLEEALRRQCPELWEREMHRTLIGPTMDPFFPTPEQVAEAERTIAEINLRRRASGESY